MYLVVLFFKQQTANEMRISGWSSDVCSSDLLDAVKRVQRGHRFLEHHGDAVAADRLQHGGPGADHLLAKFNHNDEPTLVQNESLSLRLAREIRSEEHTSELQSLMRISYAVFCLKKKIITKYTPQHATRTRVTMQS